MRPGGGLQGRPGTPSEKCYVFQIPGRGRLRGGSEPHGLGHPRAEESCQFYATRNKHEPFTGASVTYCRGACLNALPCLQ